MIRGQGVRDKPKNTLSLCEAVLSVFITLFTVLSEQQMALPCRNCTVNGIMTGRHTPPTQQNPTRRVRLNMIEFGHLSHVGLRRDLNEDTYDANAEKGLWLVADGMGGHEYGEVASALARDAAMESARAGSSLSDAIRYAAHTVAAYSQGRRSALPMGTTIAMAATTGNQYEVAWIGDSRVYLWDGQLRQISQDHSLVQEMVAQGAITSDQARSHPRRNVVTQALGVTDPDHLRIGVASGLWCSGRQLLLCTDGLTEHVSDSRIAQILARETLSVQELVEHLVFCALRGGGSDNITVVLAREV